MTAPWLERLKAAVDAGFYRTESAESEQESWPWQNKTCSSCPFWANSICQVFAEYRASMAQTCRYFDAGNHNEARQIIQRRQWQGFRRWWEWFSDRDKS